MSRNLVVHFKRMTYLVEPSPETLALGGKRVRVYEWEDGRVEIHCQGQPLPYSLFNNNQCVSQGAVVENKRLGVVLSVIQAAQAERDRGRLAGKGLTNREKERVVAARVAAEVPPPPPEQPAEDRLGGMLSFLEVFADQQKARRKMDSLKAAFRRKGQLGAALDGN